MRFRSKTLLICIHFNLGKSMQPIQDLTVDDRISRTQFQYSLEDADPNELNNWSQRLVQKLQGLPQLRDVASDQQTEGLQTTLEIDRDSASRFGITPQMIDDTLYDAFGQRLVSTMFTQLNQYHVVLEVDSKYQQNPNSLKDLYVRAPGTTQAGTQTFVQVPLTSFTRINTHTTPLAVNHQGQFPAVTLSFNLAPGASLGDAVKAIESAGREIGLPPSIRASFQGTALAFQASLANEVWLIVAALITVYIVLGVLYESYIHPITILSTLPSAGLGALLALRLTNGDLNVIALIGMILLIGIVQKNAIMAALLGGLPLALGQGTGAELRRPLGITIVGGLMVSQLLTLYTTPVVYLYLDRFRLWFERGRSRLRRRPFPQSA